jgi:hypothetical protein
LQIADCRLQIAACRLQITLTFYFELYSPSVASKTSAIIK